jgi:anti-sigma factor RsiW
MSAEYHGFQPEEVMAYLDGEVTGERALTLAEHLEDCAECSSLADDFCAISQQLIAWKIEPSPLVESRAILGVEALTAEEAMEGFKFDMESIAAPVLAQESAPAVSRGSSILSSLFDFIWRPRVQRPWVWALAGACAVMLIVASLSLRFAKVAPNQAVPASASRETKTHKVELDVSPHIGSVPNSGSNVGGHRARSNEVSVDGADTGDNSVNAVRAESLQERAPATKTDGRKYLDFTLLNSQTSREPAEMIQKTASLSMTVKELDAARTALDDIVNRHHGYFAELNTAGQSEAGRTLSASLRVPADELDTTLAELRKLGHLDQEKQGGEEVSQQYVDLVARLDNARHTEKRLTELLTKRAAKLKDVLDVEREIASTREEVERMEAQRQNLENHVNYASIELNLREEYKPALNLGPLAIGTRLRNGLVDGFHSAVESALGLVLFLFQEGPSILFWLLVLFFPARWTWRKLRAAAAQKQSLAGAL